MSKYYQYVYLEIILHVINMEAIITYLYKVATFQKEVTFGSVCVLFQLWLNVPAQPFFFMMKHFHLTLHLPLSTDSAKCIEVR